VIGACAIVSGDVLGWFDFPSDECTNIWASKIPDVRPAYFGFGIGASDGRVASVSATVPSYGTDAKGSPTFSATDTPYCVMPYPEHMSIFPSDSPDDASHCSDWVRPEVQRRAFVVCSPYRSRRRCVRVRAGSVRVVESGMFHIK
jgi:hypothetical protein